MAEMTPSSPVARELTLEVDDSGLDTYSLLPDLERGFNLRSSVS